MLDKIITEIRNCPLPIKYTYGYKWKNPITYEVPVTKEQAIDLVKFYDYGYAELTKNKSGEFYDLELLSAYDML